MWKTEMPVYVEDRNACICGRQKCLYMWKTEMPVYVEDRNACICGRQKSLHNYVLVKMSLLMNIQGYS